MNFLETGQINFANLEAEGFDVSASYEFAVEDYYFRLRLTGSHQDQLDRFFNPLDAADVDPEIQEIQRPKTTATFNASVERGALTVGMQSIYQSKQGVDEIEEVLGLGDNQALYGDAGFFDSCLLYTSPSPRDQRGSRMPSSA